MLFYSDLIYKNHLVFDFDSFSRCGAAIEKFIVTSGIFSFDKKYVLGN